MRDVIKGFLFSIGAFMAMYAVNYFEDHVRVNFGKKDVEDGKDEE